MSEEDCQDCKYYPVWKKAIGIFDAGKPCVNCVHMSDNWNISSKFEVNEPLKEERK
jgi:hypothetical protein